jgi:hypothetical protein
VTRQRLRAVLLAGVLAAGGCRSYVRVTGDTPGAGRPVRVQLTDAGSVAVAAAVGPRAVALEGAFVAVDDSALTLDARAVTRAGGDEERWPGERVRVPRSAVAVVEEVRTSVRRSALLAGGVAAGLALMRTMIGAGEGGVRVPSGGPGSGGR